MRRTAWVLVALLGVLGAGELSSQAWSRARAVVPELRRADLELTAGQGVALGLLGGFRPLLADLAWIRGYVLWERQDRTCEAHLRTACLLDPHSNYFWENRANIIGLDMAHWEIRVRGGYFAVTEATQQAIFERYARKALAALEDGLPVARNPAALLALGGYLAETKIKDPLLGAEYYLRCHRTPGSPWYSAYFHARLLRDGGKERQAYEWLRPVWQDKLSKREDGSPTELAFLRDCERSLNIPLSARIPPHPCENEPAR
jgi:hypothetical protein